MCTCDNGLVYNFKRNPTGADIAEVSLCDCPLGTKRRYWGIPDEALGWTFVTYPNDPKWRDKVRMLVDTEKWIILLGPVGTGKTSLAVSAYKILRDRGVKGAFWNAARLLDATKESYGNPDLVNHAEKLGTTCPFLVLDGLGERPLSEHEQGIVSQLLGQRYTYRLRTMITSNWSEKDFEKQLGDWVLDRLSHVGEFVHMIGESMRRVA